jgi:predicted secreted protein
MLYTHNLMVPLCREKKGRQTGREAAGRQDEKQNILNVDRKTDDVTWKRDRGRWKNDIAGRRRDNAGLKLNYSSFPFRIT